MYRILFFLALLFSTLFSNSFDVANLKKQNILDYIFYTDDKNSIYSYEDIKNKSDLKKLEVMHIGSADGPFWTKLSLLNSSDEVKYITIYNPLAGMNKIDAYIIKDNLLLNTFYLGDLREQNLRDDLSTYSNINLIINPKESITIISKLENFHIYNLGWQILQTKDFSKFENKEIFLAGLFGGIIILFCIYNFINYFLYKNKSYLIISFIALSLGIYQYGFHGILYFLNINLNLDLITALTWNASSFGGIFLLLFSYYFFEQPKKFKYFSYASIFFIFCYILLVFFMIYAQFFNEDYFKYTWTISFTILSSTLYLFIFAIYALIKKETAATYYFLGQGTLFIVIFLNTLGLFNLIFYEDTIKFLIPFAYMIDLSSLVISLYLKNKKEQEDLKKSKMLLIEQSRFNSVGQAIGHVSHQWKSPLTSIGTSLTLLETIYKHDENRLSETFEKQLPLMKKSMDLMKKSMDEFSTFYNTKSQKENFLLLSSIKNIVEMLSAKIILKRVKIEYEIEKDLNLYSYEHIISNIFLVLINNSLEAFETTNNNNIKIVAKQKENKTVIIYEDNAGGIKIKPIESAFDYFVSAKENKKSSGIGLAVVKLLVDDRLNGKISVKNSENGAIFTIII